MENVNRWYFTKDQLATTPSRKSNIDEKKELSYRQQAGHFIQDMGQRLQVSQLCINTAIVYMHRFYVFHSFSEVHRNSISVAALFLAAKVEEQPRKLEHVIKVAHLCLHKDGLHMDVRTDAYAEKQLEVVAHENVLLQTLGFVLAIEHPHTYVVRVCQLVKASKDLAQTSYFMATTSLHMTTMCLQYKPTIVACVCIHLACKWSNWKIEPCSEGREWYYYVDKSVTIEMLEALTQEFITIMEKSPHKFKRKFISQQKEGGYHGPKNILDEVAGTGKSNFTENKIGIAKKDYSSPSTSSSMPFNFPDFDEKPSDSDTSEKTEKTPIPSSHASPPRKTKSEPTSSKKVKLDLSPTRKVKLDLSPTRKVKLEPSPSKKVKLDPSPSKKIKLEPSPSKIKVKYEEPSPSKKGKPEPPHSISLAVYREKREKERQTERKTISSIPPETLKDVSKPVSLEKLPIASNDKEKPQPILNAKHVEHGFIASKEKSNKVNNVKELIPPAPTLQQKVNHQLPKITPDSNCSKESKHLPVNDVKTHKISKGNSDPFVLLTRVDEQTPGKFVLPVPESQSLENKNLVVQHSSSVIEDKYNKFKTLKHKATVLENSSEMLCDIKATLRTPETNTIAKTKHQKHKANLLHNNHSNIQQITQGELQKLSPILDSVKANGSKETDAADTRRRSTLENHIEAVKNSELPVSKHEKREKHRHKHSSSRDRTTNHVIAPASDIPPPGGGIKITIPKDKICLSGARSESSQKSYVSGKNDSPKKSIKIKIPKPPPPTMETTNAGVKPNLPGTGLKIVLTKDKSGSGSYSTSHKSERESRKRPASQDHYMKNSHDYPSVKPSKLSKVDAALYKSHHLDGVNASGKHIKIARHNAHHGIAEQQIVSKEGKLQSSMVDGAQLNLVIPYGGQLPYYPHSYSYPNVPPLSHGHMPPSIKTNSHPPLPPPLPPQPPPPPPE